MTRARSIVVFPPDDLFDNDSNHSQCERHSVRRHFTIPMLRLCVKIAGISPVKPVKLYGFDYMYEYAAVYQNWRQSVAGKRTVPWYSSTQALASASGGRQW
eukprot:scaffold112932_cov27-Prasinocladus_malaysianus.AAC.1